MDHAAQVAARRDRLADAKKVGNVADANPCRVPCRRRDAPCACHRRLRRRNQGHLRRRGAHADRRHDRGLSRSAPATPSTSRSAPTGLLRDIIASGKPADLLITSAPLMAELEKTGKLTPGSRVDLGRVGLGVVIREGAHGAGFLDAGGVPQELLDAKSVAYTAPELGGTSSVHLLALLKKLGIDDADRQEGGPRQGRHRRLAEGGAAARPRSASR